MKKIKLVFGLGNEGEEFILTRHNIGKDIVKAYFKNPKSLSYSLYEKYQKIYLGTNLTYVNEGGKSVKELTSYLKLKPEEILVIHDDADIIFPFFKCTFGAGSGGHKGIESIIKSLKTKNFWRFRIGIQKKKREEAINLVLKRWSSKERKIVEKMIKKFKIIFDLLSERLPNELNLPKDFFVQ